MLDDLLKIKRRREDDAVSAVAEARRALERQQEAARAKAQELKDYEAWQVTEKERLYDTLHNKNVTRDKLEKYREQIGLLRTRQLQLEEELLQARQEVTKAEQAVEHARQRRMDAHREVVKFEEYQRMLAEEQAREAQRKEDEETEDIVSSRR